MAMSDKEVLQKLKELTEREAEVLGKMIALEDLREITGEEIRPNVGMLQVITFAKIKEERQQLYQQVMKEARSSGKQTDPQVNIHRFIVTPDGR